MRDLFANIDYRVILQYVHECDIYRKIWSFNTSTVHMNIHLFTFIYFTCLYIFNLLVRRMGR
jgi:hypothetical protein